MEMNNFYYQVDKLFEDKKIAEAEEFMKNTLAQAEAEKDAGAVITVCNELGGYYRAVSRYSEGIPLYEKALRLMREMGLERSEHYGNPLFRLWSHTLFRLFCRRIEANTFFLGDKWYCVA